MEIEMNELRESEIDQVSGGSALSVIAGGFLAFAGASASAFYAELPAGAALL